MKSVHGWMYNLHQAQTGKLNSARNMAIRHALAMGTDQVPWMVTIVEQTKARQSPHMVICTQSQACCTMNSLLQGTTKALQHGQGPDMQEAPGAIAWLGATLEADASKAGCSHTAHTPMTDGALASMAAVQQLNALHHNRSNQHNEQKRHTHIQPAVHTA